METLMDLYNSVQSPLEDLDKVKKIIEVYSKSDKDGKDFYKNLVNLSNKKYNGRTYQKNVDKLNSVLFNLWKANIVGMKMNIKLFIQEKEITKMMIFKNCENNYQ